VTARLQGQDRGSVLTATVNSKSFILVRVGTYKKMRGSVRFGSVQFELPLLGLDGQGTRCSEDCTAKESKLLRVQAAISEFSDNSDVLSSRRASGNRTA
jgi:hypothetical protein